MNQELYEWILLLARWVHITVAVTWIGTSIFFMWLDRSFSSPANKQQEGLVGELWMVHGGGFYQVQKHLLGPTRLPAQHPLHWFKWESYWTWMSGFFLLAMIFYTGEGVFLLDSSVSSLTYFQAVALGLFSLFGSWFFYDFLWESSLSKRTPLAAHFLTVLWVVGMSYLLCQTLSGRGAYMHIGGMLGTWMTANVFLRIIPRQLKMVRASSLGEVVNQEWGKNAKNRSTHNTYLTLPVILIMLSNHFPFTYGHEKNWIILLVLCAAGASLREYFILRMSRPGGAKIFGGTGMILIVGLIFLTGEGSTPPKEITPAAVVVSTSPLVDEVKTGELTGTVSFFGEVPKGTLLNLPGGCGEQAYSDEVIVREGKLQNVLIRITKGLENIPANQKALWESIPSVPVELDQRGCLYQPRVVAARVGQEVIFINSDPLFHNVRSVTEKNKFFNLAMPKKDQRIKKTFQQAEIFVQAKCSVHPWMKAYIAVMDHPFFAVTSSSGEFHIKNLPVGSYTLEAWHEVFGTQEKIITIKNGEKTRNDFEFNNSKNHHL